MAKTSAISIRVSNDVKDALFSAACRDDRSMASYAERTIIAHLASEGWLDASPQSRPPKARVTVTAEDHEIELAARMLYHLPEQEKSAILTLIEVMHKQKTG